MRQVGDRRGERVFIFHLTSINIIIFIFITITITITINIIIFITITITINIIIFIIITIIIIGFFRFFKKPFGYCGFMKTVGFCGKPFAFN